MTLSAEKLKQVVRFAIVGGGVMLFFMVLNGFFGRWWPAQVAFLAAYPPALALHFGLNKWWTFGSTRTDTTRQLGEYLAMVVVTFAIQWTVFTGVMLTTAWPGWLAAGLANLAQMIVTFLMMQRRIFKVVTAGAPQGPRP